MPELPDVVLYVDALNARIRGERFTRLRACSPIALAAAAGGLAALG